ncbi:hypothetical protein IKE07_02755, partial [Candidatus Saccharibacteria bacterium]|nr:hypothetical protein [Candidatus Saccharibacteria bacterium]
MEGTNIEQYKDGDRSHSLTYYGNGCANTWKNEPPYYGGSTVACSVRLTKTKDDEYQNIGTYYNYHAATSGTGAAITTDNDNSPDTFCPLGWQLPYSGTDGDYYNKSRSWNYLFSVKYNYGNDSVGSSGVHSYPISNVFSGEINGGQGYLMLAGIEDSIWSIISKSANSAYRLDSTSTMVRVNWTNDKAMGQTVRCVSELETSKRSPWHPRSLISIMAFHFLKAHFP